MLVQEIITNPPRDEYLDDRLNHFDNAIVVATVKNLTLKVSTKQENLYYGLFDERDRLVGYLELEKYKDDIWQVILVQLAQVYKGMGYGTLLYDYAIMNDKRKILSDAHNTGGPHGSKNLWKSLFANKKYNIVGYDIETDKIIPDVTPDDIYNEKENIRWLALPPSETINEMLLRHQQNVKNRYIVWYGPGTTSEDYFNF